MKEKAINLNTREVRGLHDGSITLLLRVIKPPAPWVSTDEGIDIAVAIGNIKCPYSVGDRLWGRQKYGILDDSQVVNSDVLYGLTDNRLYAILTSSEVHNGRYKVAEWSSVEAYPNIPERELYGRFGRTDLLTYKIQRLWSQGLRGLASAQRMPDGEGIPRGKSLPSESQSYETNTQIGVHGFSWDATTPIFSSEAFRQQSSEQSPKQSSMGDSTGELDGQKSGRSWQRGREASNGKTNELRNESIKVGNREGASKPMPCSKDTWDVSGWRICRCPSDIITWQSSQQMPRWASRITLEVTSVEAGRVQGVTEEEAIRNGVNGGCLNCGHEQPCGCNHPEPNYRDSFIYEWDNENLKCDHFANPWVWKYGVKRV